MLNMAIILMVACALVTWVHPGITTLMAVTAIALVIGHVVYDGGEDMKDPHVDYD